MKVISINSSDSREQELLDREIQILSDMKKLKHENIVQYVECFYLDGYAYIIMEYCEGGTLFQYIRKHGIVPEHTFVDFVRQIASGLEVRFKNDKSHFGFINIKYSMTIYNPDSIA